MSLGSSTTNSGTSESALVGTKLSLGSSLVVSKPSDVLGSRMEGEFFKLIQFCLKHQPVGEDPTAFMERVGKAMINFLTITRKNDMMRILKKILKKLENALRSHAALKKITLESDTDTMLSRQVSKKEAKEKDLEGHLARYATQLAELKIIARTFE